MPKSTTGGSIRKKTVAKGGKTYTYFEGRYDCGIDPATGKRKQRSVTAPTQKEVKQKLKALMDAVDNGNYVDPCKLTVAEWLDKWMETLYTQKYGTLKSYRNSVENHLKPHIGGIKLSQLRKADIDALYKTLLESGKTVAYIDDAGKKSQKHLPLAAKSVKNIHLCLSSALKAAVDNELIPFNPMDKVKPPKVIKPTISVLTDDMIAKYVKATETDEELGSMLRFILFTGLREGEAMGLQWDTVDFKAGTITIRQQLQDHGSKNGGLTIVPTKTDKVRTILPAPYVMNLLRSQYQKQLEDRFAAGEIWQGFQNDAERKTAFCFTDTLGKPHRPKKVYQHNERICKAIGADGVTVHGLRHSYATLSLQNGDDLKTVSESLGHSSVTITADIYATVSETMRKQSSGRMQNFIESIAE